MRAGAPTVATPVGRLPTIDGRRRDRDRRRARQDIGDAAVGIGQGDGLDSRPRRAVVTWRLNVRFPLVLYVGVEVILIPDPTETAR